MKFDELNPEQLEARLAELTEETSAEKRDALSNDDLEARIEEMEAIKAELEARKAAAAEQRRIEAEVAQMSGEKIIEEDKRMNFEVNSPEYRDAFLRNLMGKELTAEERTAVTASAAIPTETANKIWGKLELYPILNAIDIMHIPGNVVLPVEGTINNAAVVAMGTAATDSADTLSAVSLGAYKLIKTVEITADVAAMSVPAFEDWLVDRLANKLFRLAATKVAAGTGTNEPTGLATITATSQTYTAAGITYADLLNIISKLPSEYLPNAKFVMSRDTFWKGVKAIKTDNDVRVVNTDVGSPAAYNILGFPVILEDQISTDVIFGDLKEGYVLNFAKDIAVDRDESVAFRTGSTVFRGMALADGKPTGVGLVRFTKASL
jgi:HK97 family phage major capsid protein